MHSYKFYKEVSQLAIELLELEFQKQWRHDCSEWLHSNRLNCDLCDLNEVSFEVEANGTCMEMPLHVVVIEAAEDIRDWYLDRYPRRSVVTVDRCFEEEDFEEWFHKTDVFKEAKRLKDDKEERLAEVKDKLRELSPKAVDHIIDFPEWQKVNVLFSDGRIYAHVLKDWLVHKYESLGLTVKAEPFNKARPTSTSWTVYVKCKDHETVIVKYLPAADKEEFEEWLEMYNEENQRRLCADDYRSYINRKVIR